jgi:trehalose transport system permease protein
MAWRDQLVPLLFVVPALIFVGALTFYPAFDAVYLSFQTPILHDTLVNYEALSFYHINQVVEYTAVFTAGALAIQFGLGLAMALVLAQAFRGKTVVSTLLLLPIGFATTVAAVSFSFIFSPSTGGYADSFLRSIGLGAPYWYSLPTASFPTASLVTVMISDSWKNTPLVMLILLAGLGTIPKSLYEAASVDGAGPIRRFLFVTLPNLRGFIAIALIIRGIQEFNVFAMFLFLAPSVHVLSTLTYDLYSGPGLPAGDSLAVASILLGFVAVFIVVVLIAGGRRR